MLDGYASSTLDLARLQFAVTTSVHFLFVILTLGLVTLVAITQTRFVVGGNPELGRMARFWGFLYVINYAVGIASGLVMEFQFGLNWSGLSRITGDVFGAPLALETLIAFVLESTFLGMWIFGWGRLPKGVHVIDGWLVREVGRQPWAVYGVLKTSDAVSDLSPSTMLASLIGFGSLLVGLAVLDWWLIARHARRGPGAEFRLDAPARVDVLV